MTNQRNSRGYLDLSPKLTSSIIPQDDNNNNNTNETINNKASKIENIDAR